MSVGIFKNGKYNKVAGNAKDSTAANTTYNNGTSGLQANNVQSAIDELNSNLIYREYSHSITSTRTTWGKVAADVEGYYLPEGYKPCAIVYRNFNGASVSSLCATTYDNDRKLNVGVTTAHSTTFTGTVGVLFIKV